MVSTGENCPALPGAMLALLIVTKVFRSGRLCSWIKPMACPISCMKTPAAPFAWQATAWLPPCRPKGLEQACASLLWVMLMKSASVAVAGVSLTIDVVFHALMARSTCCRPAEPIGKIEASI